MHGKKFFTTNINSGLFVPEEVLWNDITNVCVLLAD